MHWHEHGEYCSLWYGVPGWGVVAGCGDGVLNPLVFVVTVAGSNQAAVGKVLQRQQWISPVFSMEVLGWNRVCGTEFVGGFCMSWRFLSAGGAGGEHFVRARE